MQVQIFAWSALTSYPSSPSPDEQIGNDQTIHGSEHKQMSLLQGFQFIVSHAVAQDLPL
jgi:hypothetical protein